VTWSERENYSPDMGYIHGYDREEQERLLEQARFLEDKVFESLDLSGYRKMLEVGCGTGAECEILLRRYPELHVTGIDRSADQVAKAEEFMAGQPKFVGRYKFLVADGRDLSALGKETFDSAFFCWLLEHVSEPVLILEQTRERLAHGGKVFLTEVFNASLRIEPEIPVLVRYWEKYNELQSSLGGDPHAGIKLGLHLHLARFRNIRVWPKTFLFDARNSAGRTAMLEYWLELILSGHDQLLLRGWVSEAEIAELKNAFKEAARRAETIFQYTFFQAEGER
jgi:SAM-dependent methyltransferase